MNCSRTAVKTEAEFRKLYQDAARGMELFYGVRITVPVKIQMGDVKRLHRSLGKTFVPTAKPDGRTLGVAIKRGNDYAILLENGSPRMSSLMTLVHEMTHIWQYLNWDMDAIRRKYGAEMGREVTRAWPSGARSSTPISWARRRRPSVPRSAHECVRTSMAGAL